MVYAGAQKNAGPAGVTMVIARRDLIGHALPICPSAFDYANVAAEHCATTRRPPSRSTSPGWCSWVKANGGVAGMEAANKAKADLLYGYLDSTSFYRNPIHAPVRSRMNVPFVLRDDSLNDAFLQGAEAAGLTQLKGTRAWAACAPPSNAVRWPRCRTWSPT